MIIVIIIIIFFIFLSGLIIYLGGRKQYTKIPENKINESTNMLDISLPTNMIGYYVIARLHLSKTEHCNATSFSIYSRGISMRRYSPAYNTVTTKVKEITASTFRELFDKMIDCMTDFTIEQIEWVKKRDTTKPNETCFKYVYHVGDEFNKLNQRYNLLYASYLNELLVTKANKREDKINDIKNNFF